jgi:hypothetical protein
VGHHAARPDGRLLLRQALRCASSSPSAATPFCAAASALTLTLTRSAQVTPADLRALDFAPGSMGPKVEAACRFVEATRGIAAIGTLDDAAAMLAGHAGTRVARAPAPIEPLGGHRLPPDLCRDEGFVEAEARHITDERSGARPDAAPSRRT